MKQRKQRVGNTNKYADVVVPQSRSRYRDEALSSAATLLTMALRPAAASDDVQSNVNPMHPNRRENHELQDRHSHDQRRCQNFLQGLGRWPTYCVPSWLAAELR